MAKYYESGIYSRRCLGASLEEDIAASISSYFKAGGDAGAVKYTGGTRMDIEQGTDLVIWGVPVDITCHIAGKDHTEILPETVDIFGGVKVKFGVRTGNSHKGFTKFPVPVLVIGIEATDEFLGAWMEAILDSFYEKAGEIIDAGQSQYWDWCDANEA